MWFNKNESCYRVCNASGEDPHCSDKYVLDTSISDHLHYLGINFGAAELEGQMQALALADRAVVVDGPETGTIGVVVDPASGEAVVEAW